MHLSKPQTDNERTSSDVTQAYDRPHRFIARLGRAAVLALALAPLLPAGPAVLGGAAQAQGLFSPVIQINDSVITQYEVNQRARFLVLLGAPGDPEKTALKQLTDERLQLQAAKQLGMSATPEQVIAGQEEFAGRANLSREAFLQGLAQQGVGEETFRDFVTAGLLWREVVRTRFGASASVTEADIDRELGDAKPVPQGLRLLYSEIILPYQTEEERAQVFALARELSQLTSVDRFSAAARQYSAAPSRENGGQVDWANARDMQPGIVQLLLPLAPGQVTEMIQLPGAVALLQLRSIGDGVPPTATGSDVEYMLYQIPGGRSPEALAQAAKISADVTSCHDLFELNRREKGDPARLKHFTGSINEVPKDIALELGRLDPGETSAAITRGSNLGLLMLCKRGNPLPEGVSRDQVREALINRQLQQLAEGYLAELRDSAAIRRP